MRHPDAGECVETRSRTRAPQQLTARTSLLVPSLLEDSRLARIARSCTRPSATAWKAPSAGLCRSAHIRCRCTDVSRAHLAGRVADTRTIYRDGPRSNRNSTSSARARTRTKTSRHTRRGRSGRSSSSSSSRQARSPCCLLPDEGQRPFIGPHVPGKAR